MNNIILTRTVNKNYEYVHIITLCGFPLRIQLTGQFVSAEQSVDGHISASPGIWPMADCYRTSGNFRVVKFSCFKFSCHNIFVDRVTHENFFTATSLTRRRKVVRRACCEATAFIRNLGKQLLAKNS